MPCHQPCHLPCRRPDRPNHKKATHPCHATNPATSPAGAQIAGCVAAFPRLHMTASLHPITRTVLRVQLSIRADFEWREKGHGQALRWLILVEDSANEHIYHSEVRVRACVRVRVSACAGVHACVCACVHVCMRAFADACACACMRACVCGCVWVWDAERASQRRGKRHALGSRGCQGAPLSPTSAPAVPQALCSSRRSIPPPSCLVLAADQEDGARGRADAGLHHPHL